MKTADSNKINILINFKAGIGDFSMFTPVLRNIAKAETYNLFFIGNKNMQEFVDNFYYFKQKIYLDYEKGFFYKTIMLLKLFFKLKKLKIDICITPISCFGKFSYLSTKLSGAKVRIGFEHTKTRGIYTHIIAINDNGTDIEQNLKVLTILNIKVAVKNTELKIPKHSFKIVENYFSKQHINSNKPTIAIAPLGRRLRGYPPKEWQFDKYIELVKRILQGFDVNIIFMGSKNELGKIEKVTKTLQTDRLILQDKAFSICEAAALLKKCTLLICNDSGIMHVASAINIPIVSIWGPTTPERWGYLEKENFFAVRKNNCIPCREYKRIPPNCKKQKCLKEISVDEVFNVCERILNENSSCK